MSHFSLCALSVYPLPTNLIDLIDPSLHMNTKYYTNNECL